MSSHHIIRDQQEPALLVLSLKNTSFELIEQLLEWSPTVLCTPQTFELFLSKNTKFDYLLSNQTNITLQGERPFADFQVVICDQSIDYLQAGLQILSKLGHEFVHVIDDEKFDLLSFEMYDCMCKPIYVNQKGKSFWLKEHFSMWLSANTRLTCSGVKLSSVENLLFDPVQGDLQVVNDGQVAFDVEQPAWLTIYFS